MCPSFRSWSTPNLAFCSSAFQYIPIQDLPHTYVVLFLFIEIFPTALYVTFLMFSVS